MTFTDFLSQYQRLVARIPRAPTYSANNENCPYTGHTYHSKNSYSCFDCAYCTDCLYCFDSARTTNCVDSDYAVDSELLYECVDFYKSYNCAYSQYCARLYDSSFCYDCHDSHDLFGCTHLKQKQYCIFNKQYTKEEYEKKVSELLVRPVEENYRALAELIKRYPMGPTYVSHSQNCDFGNHVHYALDCYLCFDAARSEHCGYLYDSFYCKHCFDMTQCAHCELCYECQDSSKLYNCQWVDWSSNCFDSSYLTNCGDCHNCFGCVGVKHKKFCILNKQYTEEEYMRVMQDFRSMAH